MNRVFHSKFERAACLFGFLLAAIGLYVGYFEPFHSEKQKLAQQQFEFFRKHRRLELRLTGSFHSERLIKDLSQIDGIKSKTIELDGEEVSLLFQSDVTNKELIISVLKSKGYNPVLKN